MIVTPDLYERDRLVVTRSKFLLVEGTLQNQDNVIHVKATQLTALSERLLWKCDRMISIDRLLCAQTRLIPFGHDSVQMRGRRTGLWV